MNNMHSISLSGFNLILRCTKQLAHVVVPRKKSLFQLLIVCCCIAILNGCMKVGPDFQKPETELSDNWSESNVDLATQQHAGEEDTLASWWTVFEDDMLTSLIQKAVKNNYDIQLATSRIRQARAERGKAKSGLGPNLSVTGSYTRRQTNSNTITSEPTPSPLPEAGQSPQTGPSSPGLQEDTVIGDQYNAGFDASWELDIFGGVSRRIEAAEAELESAIEAKRNVHITLVAEVAREYVGLRALQLRINIARKNLQAQTHVADLTKKRFNGGFANGLDVANAESQTALTQAVIPQFEAASFQKIYSISVLLGQEPTEFIKELSLVEDIPSVEFSEMVPIGVPSDLLLRRPDIRGLEAKIHSATALIGEATSDLFPKFYISGFTGYQSEESDTLFTPSSWIWSFGPSFSWNIFNTGQTRANIEKQEAVTEQIVIEYQHTVIKALQEVESALIASKKEKEHFQALSNAVEANRKAVRLATLLYQGGEIDFLEVLIAQRSLLLSEDAWAQSRERLSTNLITLYKAIGGGWDVEDMSEVQ